MKALLVTTALAALLAGCNAMPKAADKILGKQSNFENTKVLYPTVDGQKDSQAAPFGKQAF
ncbi:MAG: hypothetical protein Q4B88_04595 [Moraxella sp.]|nr:hypothetical protein [Moraxella sp.]